MFIDSVINITITNVAFAIRLLKSPIGITTNRPNRERWAISLKLGGKTFYTINGKQILSDALHPVILPKGCSYSWKCVEPGECIIIEFEALESACNIFSFKISDNSYIVNAFKKIEKSLNLKNANSRLECNYQLYGILLFLIKSVKTEYVSKDKKTLLQPAINYISEHHYDCSITNDFLADICGISTVYFRKTFEKVYGTSPIKYLHNFRINKAKSILESDFESINQVAASVGYSSIYHFSKMFKLYTGKSPTEYAKASRT
ncbi:MAG: helix-turn-helix transcriptional regulator [Tyzzerella sp.]|nr:helix-turn-helix transcriptional regulator [Tyzzerella sp.]